MVEKLYETSEEGQKVSRNKGDKFVAIFRRIKSQQTWFIWTDVDFIYFILSIKFSFYTLWA